MNNSVWHSNQEFLESILAHCWYFGKIVNSRGCRTIEGVGYRQPPSVVYFGFRGAGPRMAKRTDYWGPEHLAIQYNSLDEQGLRANASTSSYIGWDSVAAPQHGVPRE